MTLLKRCETCQGSGMLEARCSLRVATRVTDREPCALFKCEDCQGGGVELEIRPHKPRSVEPKIAPAKKPQILSDSMRDLLSLIVLMGLLGLIVTIATRVQ